MKMIYYDLLCEKIFLTWITHMGINDGVDMKIISHLEEQLKFQTEVVEMTILTIVAWAVNALNLSNGRTNSMTKLVPQKERCRQELMSYLVHTERCRDII